MDSSLCGKDSYSTKNNIGCSDPEANSGYDGPLVLFQVDTPIRENISMASRYNM